MLTKGRPLCPPCSQSNDPPDSPHGYDTMVHRYTGTYPRTQLQLAQPRHMWSPPVPFPSSSDRARAAISAYICCHASIFSTLPQWCCLLARSVSGGWLAPRRRLSLASYASKEDGAPFPLYLAAVCLCLWLCSVLPPPTRILLSPSFGNQTNDTPWTGV